MLQKPKLDDQQKKMKSRLSTLYALLILIVIVIAALLLSMKPVNSISLKRDSVSLKLMYFDGNIDYSGVDLSDSDKRRLKSFNDNPICISAYKTAEMTEESAKNFLLSWLYVHFPGVDIKDDSVTYSKTKWRQSYNACDDTYLSNVFQYDRRQAQSDISMDNVVENWMRSGLIIFLGSINVIMVLWFISIYRKELEHYNKR